MRRFDPSTRNDLLTYAVPTIRGEVMRHFRDHGWAVRTPRDVQELAVRLGPVSEELTARLRRAPTPGELAEHCGSSVEQVLEVPPGLSKREASLQGMRIELSRVAGADGGLAH